MGVVTESSGPQPCRRRTSRSRPVLLPRLLSTPGTGCSGGRGHGRPRIRPIPLRAALRRVRSPSGRAACPPSTPTGSRCGRGPGSWPVSRPFLPGTTSSSRPPCRWLPSRTRPRGRPGHGRRAAGEGSRPRLPPPHRTEPPSHAGHPVLTVPAGSGKRICPSDSRSSGRTTPMTPFCARPPSTRARGVSHASARSRGVLGPCAEPDSDWRPVLAAVPPFFARTEASSTIAEVHSTSPRAPSSSSTARCGRRHRPASVHTVKRRCAVAGDVPNVGGNGAVGSRVHREPDSSIDQRPGPAACRTNIKSRGTTSTPCRQIPVVRSEGGPGGGRRVRRCVRSACRAQALVLVVRGSAPGAARVRAWRRGAGGNLTTGPSVTAHDRCVRAPRSAPSGGSRR